MAIHRDLVITVLVCLGALALFYWDSAPARRSLLPRILPPKDKVLETGCHLQKDIYTLHNRHMTLYEFLNVEPNADESDIVQSLQKTQRESWAASNTCATASHHLCPKHYQEQLYKLALTNRAVLFLLDSRVQRDRYDAEIYYALVHVAILAEEDRAAAAAAAAAANPRGNGSGGKGWWIWRLARWVRYSESESDRKLRMIQDKAAKNTEAQTEARQSFTQLCGST